MCTAIVDKYVITDPVFFFDLSDLNNITYKDTGEIEGYSSSLVNFGDGYLLGIGYGDTTDDLKIEIYAEGEESIICVCEYVLEDVQFSDDYKAYFIDRENKLIGLGVQYGNGGNYLILSFDGNELTASPFVKEIIHSVNIQRAVLIDEYLFILDCGLDVIPLDEIIPE